MIPRVLASAAVRRGDQAIFISSLVLSCFRSPAVRWFLWSTDVRRHALTILNDDLRHALHMLRSRLCSQYADAGSVSLFCPSKSASSFSCRILCASKPPQKREESQSHNRRALRALELSPSARGEPHLPSSDKHPLAATCTHTCVSVCVPHTPLWACVSSVHTSWPPPMP